MTEIEKINSKINDYPQGIEAQIYQLKRLFLEIGFNYDLSYYHSFSIRFEGLFAMQTQAYWKIEPGSKLIEIIDDTNYTDQADEFISKLRVITGNIIYKLNNSDNCSIYIAAESVVLIDKMEKYY